METVPHAVDPQCAAQHGSVVMRLVDEIFPLVEGVYVDLHKNPELSHQERRTANAVAEWLNRAGFEVETGIGGTGVVGILRNGEGPTVLLRGDMDALPLEERTGLPYASTAHGVDDDGNDVPVMHACGHDAHTACLVGAADLLADAREEWRGTLVVVAQPAEETADGAATMLRDGLYTRFGRPDIALAQHIGPQPAGMISHRAGVILAAARTLRVRVVGSGGHASQPHTTVDPVLIAANIVTRLQSIVSREVSPSEMAVVTVGTIRAGTKANIIPDEAYLEINTRALNDSVSEQLHEAIERVVRAEAAAAGAPQEPEITPTEQTGVTHNEIEATQQVASAHRAYFGDGYVVDLPEPFTGSEDFGELGLPGDPEPVPYVFWFVGATPHDVWEAAPGATPYEKLASLPGNHSAYFAPERELTLRAGLAALTMGALTYLGRPEQSAATEMHERAPAGPPGDAEVPVMPPGPAGYPEPVGGPAGDVPGESTERADMDALLDEDNGAPANAENQPPQGPPPGPPQGVPTEAPPPGPTGVPTDAPPPPQGPPVDAPPPPLTLPPGPPPQGAPFDAPPPESDPYGPPSGPPQGTPFDAPPPPPYAAPYPPPERGPDDPLAGPPAEDAYDPNREPPQDPPYRL